ncbi:MAG TPA: PIN domain-containing protein [Pyrinomonadaceae bacterium]|nr:PIN domain-containing protein [Pyrinomonadaceae bacterium]
MAIIVDTDVTSYLLKQDSRAELYRPHLFGLPKMISFMTLAELRRWEIQNNWGEKRKVKAREFLAAFAVVYADEKLCEYWAKIKSEEHKKGNPIDTADAWVAAAALMFGVPLVTHNRRHFENINGLQIVSES